MDERLEHNRRYWDEAAAAHLTSEFYDVEGFKRGRDPLTPLEDEEMGDVAERDLLHLQCHFGQDTLALARRGARVTGVDFSPAAIAAARALADELGIAARFVESDVYRLPERLEDNFDVVYTAWGVLGWLPDLPRWAEVVARFLRPGGRLHLLEIHPFAHVLAEGTGRPEVGNPYFDVGTLRCETGGATYAVSDGIDVEYNYEWRRTLSGIFEAVLGAGLRIESFREFPRTCFRHFPWVEKRDDGWWHIREGLPSLPLSFALRAVKEESR